LHASEPMDLIRLLPTINAVLNATATVLLVIGYVLIKRRREQAHKWTMLAAFGVSCAFLACYLVYHFQVGSVHFEGPPPMRAIYLTILLTHVLLAVTVPFLAGMTIYLGLRDRRRAHRRVARWTYPIWLYVSVTGVVIYVLLYQLFPPSGQSSIIREPNASRLNAEAPP
jgi:putative membrane protein